MICRCKENGKECKQYTFHVNQHESSAILNALQSVVTRLESLNTGEQTDWQVMWDRMVELNKMTHMREWNDNCIKELKELIEKLIVKEIS